MRFRLSIFVGLVLCVVLLAAYGLFHRTIDSRDGWRPNAVYSNVGGSSYSTTTFSGVSSSANGLGAPAVSMRGSNSMLRRRAVSSYAPAYAAPTSLIASSPYRLGASASSGVAPVYTTSSATAKSFGSGNAVSGVSMSGGSVCATNSQSSIAHSQSSIANIQLPIANIQSPTANTQLPISNIQSPIASNYQGIGNTTIGGPRAMRGRQNGAPTLNDPWWVWFDKWIGNNGSDYSNGNENEYVFDRYTLYEVYQDFLEYYWNSGMTDTPSFDQWLDWYLQAMSDGGGSYKYGDNTYFWQPVGDVWPLVVMLLFYAGYVFVRKRKQLKVNA